MCRFDSCHPSLCAFGRAARSRAPNPARRVRLPQGTLGDRLTVGQPALNRRMKVRILLPELVSGELSESASLTTHRSAHLVRGSSTAERQALNLDVVGSNPAPGARWCSSIGRATDF